MNINRVAQASSINITGAYFNKHENVKPVYFPLDEEHPCTPDEPYGLSKLIMEIQGDAIVRRFPQMRVVSIRTHWALTTARYPEAWIDKDESAFNFWGYTNLRSSAEAFLMGLTANEACFQTGHEAIFVVSPKIASYKTTAQLLAQYWPNVPLKRKLADEEALYDSSKATRILGWVHADTD